MMDLQFAKQRREELLREAELIALAERQEQLAQEMQTTRRLLPMVHSGHASPPAHLEA